MRNLTITAGSSMAAIDRSVQALVGSPYDSTAPRFN
jgi:hypothetical protein